MIMSVDRIWETIIATLLASAGGLARLLSLKDTSSISLMKLLSELFISGFAGLMVLMLARTIGLSGDWLGLVSGVAGWIGPGVIDLLIKPAGAAIGLDLNKSEVK